jgi:polygalacturonase
MEQSKSSQLVDVTREGVVPSSKELTTKGIQKIIDRLGEIGGGVLFFPPGEYRIGTIHLRSGITLDIAAGAILRASEAMEDYPYYETEINPDNHEDLQPHHLIVADNIDNIRITGGGIIDGSGKSFWDPPKSCEFYTARTQRPSPMIELRNCRNVRIENVTIANSPGWTLHINGCSSMWIRAITIDNCITGPNTDGLDITDSRDVFVSDSKLVCGDDAIVLKSLGGVNERITVTNCILETRCSALKLGANESYGTIRQVSMSNCVIYDSSRGISLYCMTGGTFEDITFSNIVMDCHIDVKLVCPIHINASRNPSENRPQKIGKIRNVRVSGMLVKSDARILLTCEDGEMLENIFLRDIHMEYPVVEDEFDLAAKAVALQFSPFSPEARAARAVVAASNIKGLTLEGLTVSWPENPGVSMQVLYAKNIEGGLIDCPTATTSMPGLERYCIEESDLIVRG